MTDKMITTEVSHPEWLPDAFEAIRRTIALDEQSLLPEKIRGWMLVVPCLRLLRCVFGSDEATVTSLQQWIQKEKACEHVPVIIHRTGGPSVDLKNTCAKCGRMIQRENSVWVIDLEREACPFIPEQGTETPKSPQANRPLIGQHKKLNGSESRNS